MKFEELKTYVVEEIKDWVTNADAQELNDDYALDMRNCRSFRDNMIMERDYGTHSKIPCIPLDRSDSFTKYVENATIVSNKIRLTITAHPYTTGMTLYSEPGQGAIEVGGRWTVTKIDANTIELDESSIGSFGVAFTSGGLVGKNTIVAHRMQVITADDGTEQTVLFGTSNSGSYMQIYVWDDHSGAGYGWYSWKKLTRKMTGTVTTLGANTDSNTILSAQTEEGVSVKLTANELNGFYVYNTTRSSALTILSHSASALGATVTNVVFAGCSLSFATMGWVNGDSIEIYSSPLLRGSNTYLNQYDYQSYGGTILSTNIIAGDRRKKFLAVHRANTDITPVVIKKMDATTLFNEILGTSYTVPAGWTPLAMDMEPSCSYAVSTYNGYTSYNQFLHTAYTTQASAIIGDSNNTWMNILGTVTNGVDDSTVKQYMRVIVTLEYDGYQHSDPIARFGFASNKTPTSGRPLGYLWFYVCPERMPKNVTGINIWMSTKLKYKNGVSTNDNLQDPPTDWQDDYSEYVLFQNMPISTTISAGIMANVSPVGDTTTKGKWIFANSRNISSSEPIDDPTMTLLGALGRVPVVPELDTTTGRGFRPITTNKPKFAALVSRSRGSVIVVNKGNELLSFNSVNGDGVVEDTSFPDLPFDNTNEPLQVSLNNYGPLKGLAVAGETIFSFKGNTLELYDIQSKIQRSFIIDFCSATSIVETPYGVGWAGYNGIYFFPIGTPEPMLINEKWLNLYAGTLVDSSNNQRITAAFKEAIVAGYDDNYKEMCFVLQTYPAIYSATAETLIYRYNVVEKKWSIRKFEFTAYNSTTTTLKQFLKRKDGTTSILNGRSILTYPSRALTVVSRYKDDAILTSNGTEFGGNGYVSYIEFNIGKLYSLSKQIIAKALMLDHVGTSAGGSDNLRVYIYANRETTAYVGTSESTAKQIPIGSKPLWRMIAPRGQINAIRVKISTYSANVSDTRDVYVNKFVLGYDDMIRTGDK